MCLRFNLIASIGSDCDETPSQVIQVNSLLFGLLAGRIKQTLYLTIFGENRAHHESKILRHSGITLPSDTGAVQPI